MIHLRFLPVTFGVMLAMLGALFATGAAKAIEVQTATSPGGVAFWLYEDHNAPIISIDFAFVGAGASADGAEKQGLANLVSGLLDEGAGNFDSLAFQTRTDDLGASLGFSAGRDDFSGSFTSLSATIDQSVDLLQLALGEPHFDKKAVARIKNQIVAGIARADQNPKSIAYQKWMARSFPDSGYGRPVRGTIESVAAISQADLHGFMSAHLTRSNLVISIVGDVDADKAGHLIDRAFGHLPIGKPVPTQDEIAPAAVGVEVIDLPIPQTVIQFGMPGLLRHDPDFLPAYVMNHILGGGSFSSRLMVEIREKRGLTYGVGTGLSAYRNAGILSGGLSTKNDNARQVIALIRQTISEIAANGVTDKELEDAKRYLIGAYPLRFDSNAKIAGQLLGLQLTGLGPEYFDDRNDMIAAITKDDVARVAARLLRDDLLYIVAVGQPEGLAPTASTNPH